MCPKTQRERERERASWSIITVDNTVGVIRVWPIEYLIKENKMKICARTHRHAQTHIGTHTYTHIPIGFALHKLQCELTVKVRESIIIRFIGAAPPRRLRMQFIYV